MEFVVMFINDCFVNKYTVFVYKKYSFINFTTCQYFF